MDDEVQLGQQALDVGAVPESVKAVLEAGHRELEIEALVVEGAFGFFRIALTDQQEMGLGQARSRESGRLGKHILCLAQADLTDGRQQIRVRRQLQFIPERGIGRIVHEAARIHSGVNNLRAGRVEALRLVEVADGLRDGDEPAIPIELLDGPSRQGDDVPQVGSRWHAQIGGQLPGEPAHRQAVAVHQVGLHAGRRGADFLEQRRRAAAFAVVVGSKR
jgi:hypothetical protein